MFVKLKIFVQWILDNRKPMLTIAVFACVLVEYCHVCWKTEQLVDFGSNTFLFCCLLLGIDLAHTGYQSKIDNSKGPSNGS